MKSDPGPFGNLERLSVIQPYRKCPHQTLHKKSYWKRDIWQHRERRNKRQPTIQNVRIKHWKRWKSRIKWKHRSKKVGTLQSFKFVLIWPIIFQITLPNLPYFPTILLQALSACLHCLHACALFTRITAGEMPSHLKKPNAVKWRSGGVGANGSNQKEESIAHPLIVSPPCPFPQRNCF